jgi:hypothetical protein
MRAIQTFFWLIDACRLDNRVEPGHDEEVRTTPVGIRHTENKSAVPP